MIQFLLNQTPVDLDPEYGTITVLDYLRSEQNLCGTKEGCASGDCGACTVVVATAGEDALDYRTINSCITFVGTLHGKQLLTVEHLENNSQLHPVQQAMVDFHGSQCGFCTPGFVMSMFALYKYRGDKNRATVDEYLAGNLCRCTGYRPIIDAALAACSRQSSDQFSHREQAIARQLILISEAASPSGDSDNCRQFQAPESADELADILAKNPRARLSAGSTDLALEVTQQLKRIDSLVYVGQVAELLRIQEEPQQYRIGAAVSYSSCYPLLHDTYPEFAEMLLRLGSLQIRNQGTLGGNIGNASPIGDTPPVLIALRSEVVLRSSGGTRQIAVEDYFHDYKKTELKPGEFIYEILLPKPLPGYLLKVYKISKRLDDDISAVLMAIWIHYDGETVRDIVIACGGMAAIPKRALKCERALKNKPLDANTLRAAKSALGEDFQPIDDVRASAHYRLRVAQNLLTRLQLEMTGPDLQTQIVQHA